MTIIFYSTSDDDLKVTKSLTQIGSYTCQLLGECDIYNPRVIITEAANLLGANYCYISDFHRYYYAKPIMLDGTRIAFECSVDRLMSFVSPYKASILAYIERNQNDYNKNLLDEQGIFTNDRDIKTVVIKNNGIAKPIDAFKLVGFFNAGLCNTIPEVTP